MVRSTFDILFKLKKQKPAQNDCSIHNTAPTMASDQRLGLKSYTDQRKWYSFITLTSMSKDFNK